MIAKLQKGDINIADVFLNELSRNPAYFNMDAVKTLIPNEEQRMRILRVLEDHMVIEIKGGGIWLKAAANLSVCKDQGGCAVIYNEQRKQRRGKITNAIKFVGIVIAALAGIITIWQFINDVIYSLAHT